MNLILTVRVNKVIKESYVYRVEFELWFGGRVPGHPAHLMVSDFPKGTVLPEPGDEWTFKIGEVE